MFFKVKLNFPKLFEYLLFIQANPNTSFATNQDRTSQVIKLLFWNIKSTVFSFNIELSTYQNGFLDLLLEAELENLTDAFKMAFTIKCDTENSMKPKTFFLFLLTVVIYLKLVLVPPVLVRNG